MFCPDPVNCAQFIPNESNIEPDLTFKPIATLPVLHSKFSIDDDVAPITVDAKLLDPPLGNVPQRSWTPDA
jgi:hypothetical protein